MLSVLTLLWLVVPDAAAYVDPKCEGKTQTFDDEGQQNFLLNYFALGTTFSAIHAPLPHEPGRGALSLEIAGIPPLSCERRLVLNSSKTEDTNKAPAAPRPRLSFTMPEVGPVAVFGSVGYVPPVTFNGVRNVIVSGEIGVGKELESGVQVGARYHATMLKTIGEIATPFVEGDPAYDEFYSGSTFGLDLSVGKNLGAVTPYVSVGATDVSTFFLIGDDTYVGLNTDPFFGVVAAAGVAGVAREHIDWGAEFYTAPGYIYTGRARVGYLF
ncbi:MAG: hypothetical protein IPO67_19590 [Deltaproteobacteria bacterium]|nr:hypothetical protein [Deltaproteobacteria bacterium]MBK9364865.1 hypothetical protein [Deltaproteobacteria bacterium]MBK9647329.1 hypothetical protein [Deltaproteobacteria bacterium]